ncbi:MAG: hypothetical protein ABIQ12_06405 [Opitutaceae bacterium]
MNPAARALLLLASALFLTGCATQGPNPKPAVLADGALLPSPRLIVGRVIAVDPANGFAFLEVSGDAPADALAAGAELITRTLELRETARLRASRYLRGRTLGTGIISGQPTPGDEVVWLAP